VELPGQKADAECIEFECHAPILTESLPIM
jgi:hypothetical protein